MALLDFLNSNNQPSTGGIKDPKDQLMTLTDVVAPSAI
jgi:hypothetical protein